MMLKNISNEDLQRVALVLASLVGIKHRIEFQTAAVPQFIKRMKFCFGGDIATYVDLAIEEADKMICDADKKGEHYIESIETLEMSGLDGLTATNNHKFALTSRELALSNILRKIRGVSPLQPKEFFLAG